MHILVNIIIFHWTVAANILNKQLRTADKVWSSSLGFWRGEYITEEQRSVLLFCGQIDSDAKDIHKEMFPVYDGKCLSRKAVHNWVEKFSQGRRS
jgi:hypothetical protein